jgi:hypothetical protein
VAATRVPHERQPGDDDCSGAIRAQAAHRSQPLFEATVVGFDPVVRVLLDVVPRRQHQLVKDSWVDRRGISPVP